MTTVVKCSVLCSLVITSNSMESPHIEAPGTSCNAKHTLKSALHIPTLHSSVREAPQDSAAEDKHVFRSVTREHLTCAYTAIFSVTSAYTQ